MIDNFYLALAAILLLPIIPAFILYKYLPASDTDVSGPYNALSLKLKGAFAGYFLLVIVGTVLQYATMQNSQRRQIEQLTQSLQQKDTAIKTLQSQLNDAGNPIVDWKIKGLVSPAGAANTRFFYDDGTTENRPDGSFQLIKRSIAKEGVAHPPRWICVYNAQTGFRVVSLNRELPHPDIAAYAVRFNDAGHEIIIGKPIDINSRKGDSAKAVAAFLSQKNAER